MFDKFLDALDDDPFEEYPVGVREFVEGENFLNHPHLSEIQYNAVECMSQIYYEDDLARFMTETDAHEHYKKFTKTEVILQLGKGCHDPDTPVYSPEHGGWIPLRDHYCAVESNGPRYATEAFLEGVDQMYKVTFGNGMYEIVSGDHKYLAAPPRTKDVKDYNFIEVNQLNRNDRVAWNRHYSVVNPIDLPLDEVEILALCSNRYEVDEDGVTFKIHYFHSNLKDLLVKKFGAVASYATATITDVRVKDKSFVNVMRKYGLLVPHNDKRIPLALFRSSNDILVHFLKTAFEYVGGYGFRASTRWGYYVRRMPHQYGQDFAHVLMRVGILPSVVQKDVIYMYGDPRQQYDVYVDSYPHNKMLADLLGEEREFPNANNRALRKTALVTDNHYLVPVYSIEPVHVGEYWTKTVPDTGWYVGNGAISSNSGKDLLSTIAVSYVVYKLLCLKDPARHYGKPSGDAIDIINIAINAQQAKNVFFKGLKNKVSQSPWFAGKYTDTQESIAFIKSVTAYSGHSERESHEGLNLIMAVLDEISGFGEATALNEQGKSAQNIYEAFRASVDSRFPGGVGCVALLSFPRHREDFITTKYNNAVVSKETVIRKHQYVINPDLPPTDDNTFEIEWEEDHIQQYVLPDVWAVKRPSWEVNPTRDIEDYKNSFFRNKIEALQRFACMPSDRSNDSFFRSEEKIDRAMVIRNPVDRNRTIEESWRPDPNKTYYVHADLAQKQDKCAVAVAHVEKWTHLEGPSGSKQVVPFVVVDMLAWWEPQVEGPVDLSEVKRWIIDLRRRGLDIGFVSFDRWGCLSQDTEVYTDNGPIPIKDVEVGTGVLTRNGYSTITAKRNTGEQQVRRIKTTLGYAIDATDDHRVLTKNGWKKAGDLEVGDYLYIQKPEPVYKESVFSQQAYVAGALVADGWLNDPKDQAIGFTNADKECVDAVIDGLRTGFGYQNNPVVTNRGAASDYRFWSVKMVKNLREFGLGRQLAATKYVPERIINGGPDAYAEFLAGYIDGDGGVQTYVDRSGITRYRVTMDTISPRLSEQVRWMIQSLGVNVTCMRNNNRGGVRSEYYRITIEGDEAVKLLSIVKPRVPRKQAAVGTHSRAPRWRFDESGGKWLPIKSITQLPAVETYDISVEAEEFVANGIVTHNSFDLIRELTERGFKSDTLSVAKKHYEDFAMMLYEERVLIPRDDTLKAEMLALKVIKNKVDHPRKANKDLSDAVTGAIYNAISKTPRNVNQTIEVHTWSPTTDVVESVEPQYSPEQRDAAAEWLKSQTWLEGMNVL